MLVHANRKSPPSTARYVEAEVPDTVSREVFPESAHPGWDDPYDVSVAQAFGEAWLRGGAIRGAAVTRLDGNAVVNPDHPEAGMIRVGAERKVGLDPRVFGV